MIEKFAITRREEPSELLDLNHASRIQTLVSPMLPGRAREDAARDGAPGKWDTRQA